MEELFITYKDSSIHYWRIGNGPKTLFAFHGYGEEGRTFEVMEELLGSAYTIIAIDFPFHGATDWKNGLTFTVDDLLGVMTLIDPFPGKQVCLLGYSMGGRVSLHVLQTVPAMIERVVLVAPDGLHHNFWHWFSTQTMIGNRLFASAMERPAFMFAMMKFAYKMNWFNKTIFNFVHYYLDDAASRRILYHRWTTMRCFKPRLGLLRNILQQNNIPLSILFGKYDRIIVTKRGKQFQKGAEELIFVKELEAGHQLLKEKYAAEIAALFTA